MAHPCFRISQRKPCSMCNHLQTPCSSCTGTPMEGVKMLHGCPGRLHRESRGEAKGKGEGESQAVAMAGRSDDPSTDERVIPASRRPDGTLRKEIRIRAGYIPQDEVVKYVARGTRPKSDGPQLPPGIDPEYAAAQMSAKKKAAKKNEKRKEKKAAAGASSSSGGDGHVAAAADVAGTLSSLSVQDRDASGTSQAPAPGGGASLGAASQQGEDGPASVEKQLRAIRKKIRQAESLEAAIASRGGKMTAEEQDKITRLGAWREEEASLQKQLG